MSEHPETPMPDAGLAAPSWPEPPLAAAPLPLPFEDPERYPGLWERIYETFRLAFTHTWAFFEAIPSGSGLGSPWRFQLLCWLPMLVLAAIGLALLALIGGLAAVAGAVSKQGLAALAGGTLALVSLAVLLLLPLGIFLGMVISGALTHVFLWIWGGTRQRVGLEQTIRAEGFVSGISVVLMIPFQILGIIPIIGLVFSFCAGIITIGITVVKGMGLARIHRTDTWRGVCAALSPMILGCCCIVVAVILAISIPAMMR